MRIKILDPRYNDYGIVPATEQSAAIDLRACIDQEDVLFFNDQLAVPLGIACEVPEGCGLFLIPRSGLGTKGIVLANTVGLIDPDYRGELVAVLWNRKEKPIKISPMERIVQATLVQCHAPTVEIVEELSNTTRGLGGFGHSGRI